MGGSPDFQTGFNLILCYFALGDADKMKRGFSKLLSIPIQVYLSSLLPANPPAQAKAAS